MANFGLYNPAFERDSCGIGFVANIKGNKSHQVISDALTVLENMEHRGACGCENNTGDGAGIMIQTPHEFFFDECIKLGVHLPSFGKYGVGVIFFPKEIRLREECRDIFNRSAEKLGLEILAYRKVPVNPDGIGPTALSVWNRKLNRYLLLALIILQILMILKENYLCFAIMQATLSIIL